MFDPYHKWFGIAKEEQPPTFYRLLGVNHNEQDCEVIEEAAIKQTSHLRTFQLGPHAAECTRLLNEIAQARATLLDPVKRKAYDARLAEKAAYARPKESPTTAPHHQGAARGRMLVGVMATICLAGAALLLWMLFRNPAAADKSAKQSKDRETASHLPFLAAINDAELAAHAERDRQGAQYVSEQIELGDGWWSLAQKPKFADLREQLLNRARFWYVRALPNADEGPRKLEVEDRALLVVNKLKLRPGLVAELFEGHEMGRRRARRIDYQLNFNWSINPPHPKAPADHFTIRWTGWLKAPKLAKYIHHFHVDDGLRFVMDGQTLLDYRSVNTEDHREITVNFTQPYHQVLVDFLKGEGFATIHWSWHEPGGADEPVPADALFHDQHQREVFTCDYNLFQGSWTLNYTNGVTRDYVFDGLGNIVNWDKAKLHRKNGEWILDARDDRLERLRIVEGKLHIDHYFPASTYPGDAMITAVGVKKK